MCNVYAHRKDLNVSLLTFLKKSSQEILYFDMFILVGRTDSVNKLKQVFLQPYMLFPEDSNNQTFRKMWLFAWSSSIVISCSMLLFQVVHELLLLGMVQDKAYPEKKKKKHISICLYLKGRPRNDSNHSSCRSPLSHSFSDLTKKQSMEWKRLGVKKGKKGKKESHYSFWNERLSICQVLSGLQDKFPNVTTSNS